ncbi:MAG: glycosyl transferase [marine bacterium B5-7]|nr:MAG: glycosyl transferase [marine bacterium B5-7]
MTSQPQVSILVNCFNGERYLRQALDSIVNQSFENWEIILWDNRSTDGSASIVDEYKDPRIRYFLAPTHTHLGEARMQAQPLLTGEWLAILDVDDLWYPDKLKKQLDAAHRNKPVGFVYSQVKVRAETADQRLIEDHVFSKMAGASLPSGNIYQALLRGNYIAVPSLLINRNVFMEIGGFSGRYPVMEDYYITLNIARKHEVAVVNEVLCEYRVHDENRSSQSRDENLEDLQILRELYPDAAAMMATPRIIYRHIAKRLGNGKKPQFGRIFNVIRKGHEVLS